MSEQDKDKEIQRLKERERSLMRQLDLARATIAFQAHGILAMNAENTSTQGSPPNLS
jgi:hypothetical protein